MKTGPVGRVVRVLAVYAAVAWAITWGAKRLAVVLALPPLFRTLTVALLVLGVPAAVALAWRYPELGPGPSSEPPSEGGRRRP